MTVLARAALTLHYGCGWDDDAGVRQYQTVAPENISAFLTALAPRKVTVVRLAMLSRPL